SDVAPVLISLGAEVEIASRSGRRSLPVDEFFVGDGIHNNVLQPHELVTGIRVPLAARGLKTSYQKVRPRHSIDFPVLSIAFAARLAADRCEEMRLVVSALAAKPRVVGGLEAIAVGHLFDAAIIE